VGRKARSAGRALGLMIGQQSLKVCLVLMFIGTVLHICLPLS
jgi:hypothetical protein